MENTLKLIVKDVYGKELVYPDCYTSELLATLKGTKTFNDRDLSIFALMGYKIEWVAKARRVG
jgi:hypothetical protein